MLKFIGVIFLYSLMNSFKVFAFDDLGPRRQLFKIGGIDVQGLKKVEKASDSGANWRSSWDDA